MKKKILSSFILLLLLAGLIVLGNSVVVTQEDEYTLIKEFGKIKTVREESGISFKTPFMQTVDKLPKCVQLYDLSASDVITKDSKTMITDSYVTWKITNPIRFAQTLNSSVSNAESRIDVAVYNSMKRIIGSMTQSELITERTGLLSEKTFDNIGTSMEDQYGIKILTIDMKHLDLPDSNKSAVYERMISERENIATTYTAEGESEAKQIRNTTNNEINIMLSNANLQAQKLIAEGEAEYMRILQATYSDEDRSEFYAFARALDAAKVSYVGSNKTLILSKDSPLAGIFYDTK